ncbi:hypothetical protein NKDENANG_03019 [Candidatus Entotheonellaceae bacterium PAL068K]
MSASPYRQATQKALLDLFAEATGLPLVLYELHNGHPKALYTDRALSNFEPHCKLIHTFQGGKARCEQDQCDRALAVFTSQREQPGLCHAGLHNEAVPIKLRGQMCAVLLCGETQFEGQREAALQKHAQVVARLDLSKGQAVQLRQRLLQVKTYSPQRMALFKATLVKLMQYFYEIVEQEERLRHTVERVSHEIQIRLQAVVAEAENLALDLTSLSPEEAVEQSNNLLYTTLALSTVVQSLNLGASLAEYRFQKRSIAGLVYEAVHLYEAEAARRGISLNVTLEPLTGPPPMLQISASHLQYALNNLVHNAVKYSFRGQPDRPRYVKISGRPAGHCYHLCFENYGIGLLPEEIKQGLPFQDGYQGKLSQGEYRTGSGKGLTFVKQVIERHRGRIDLESTPRRDPDAPHRQPHLNRFIVTLPYVQPKRS